MSIPVIAFFNNKGGVGKTSLVYHLAWMYDRLNIPVLVADLDPQANLTSNFLDENELETFWLDDNSYPIKTIYDSVKPLITGEGDFERPILKKFGNTGLLLAGDLQLSQFEGSLSGAWYESLTGLIRGMRITSAFWGILQQQATEHQAKIILVDMGPNLGAINRTILLSANYIVIPLVADLFSLQGLKNLGTTLRDWQDDWETAIKAYNKKNGVSENLNIPTGIIQPLGYIVMQHGERLDRNVKIYEKWMSRIPKIYIENVLNDTIDNHPKPHKIGQIRHYRSLMAMAHEARKPIFELKSADGAIGSHVRLVGTAYDNFEAIAIEIAKRINLLIPQDD